MENANFLYINTGKDSGISLENSLGCDRVYTLVSLKKCYVKESRYEEMLGGLKITTEQTPLQEKLSLSEK